MRKRRLLTATLGFLLLIVATGSPYAQKQPKTLTILYTNNINGEIDPCPT